MSNNPDFDCSGIVNDALSKEKNIYFNKGTYYFSKPIDLNGMQLIGAGNTVSILNYIGTENNFITAKGDFLIEHLNLRYDTSIDATNSVSGEKVILSLGTESQAATGNIKNVYFGNCGTAIYEASSSLPSHNLNIDTITVMGFKYSGIQINSLGRKDNTYENLYLSKGSTEQNAYSGFELNGSDSNTTIRQLNVEHFGAKYPVILNGCDNLNAKTIHIEGTNLIADNVGYVNVSNTNGRINALTLAWTRVSGDNCSVISFGNAQTEGNTLTIGTLQARGINDPTESYGEWNRGINILNDFSFISRLSGSNNEYSCTIDNYVYYTTLSDVSHYEFFACDDKLIDITQKGNISTYGTTSERPTSRLCANHSTYFDTDLEQLLVWNGLEWVA